MKSIVLSLAFLSLALCDRLDNRYLPPPNNALIANGDYNPYPANAPIVEDLRTTKTSNPIFGQASESKSQYAVPAAQTIDAKVLSRQYLLPANQYSSSTPGQQAEPSGQSSISNNQYSKPNGQFTSTFQHSGPASQSTVSTGQYSKPNGQFDSAFQHSGPASQSTVSTGQYSKPNGQFGSAFQHSGPASQSTVSTGQYSKLNGQFGSAFQHSGPASQSTGTSGQYSKPNGQFGSALQHSGPAIQSTGPSGQYSKPNGQFGNSFQYSGPTSQPTVSSGQYSKRNGQFGNTFQHSGPASQSIGSSSQYSKPNGQFSSSFQHPGSYAAPNEQFSSSFQQSKPSDQSTASFNQNSKANAQVPAVSQTFEPSGQSTISNNQYSKPIAQFSGSYQRTEPSGAYSGTSGQAVPSQYYKNAAPIATVKSSNVPNSGDGYYSYNYETENGIMAQEEGSLVNDAENARGGYSYTSPEGERVVVEYTADGDGFKPTGSHIPQVPEAILKSIELNKAALARGEYQEGQYHEENEQGYAKSGPGGQYGSNAKFEGYNSKYASPSLEASVGASSEASFSSVQSDKFVPAGFQQTTKNGFFSHQQQTAGSAIGTDPQQSFAASEPSKIQFGGPHQAYGVPSFQSGTVQDTKGGYKY